MDEWVEIRIKKVVGPMHQGTAVFLGNDDKTFVMFIGSAEGSALMRQLNDEEPVRPFTHELLWSILVGFNVSVKKVVISDLVNTTFCATLILEQPVVDEGEQWVGKRNEVRIDARPSDCLVLASKAGIPIFCARNVLDNVDDATRVKDGADEKPSASADFLSAIWDEPDEDGK